MLSTVQFSTLLCSFLLPALREQFSNSHQFNKCITDLNCVFFLVIWGYQILSVKSFCYHTEGVFNTWQSPSISVPRQKDSQCLCYLMLRFIRRCRKSGTTVVVPQWMYERDTHSCSLRHVSFSIIVIFSSDGPIKLNQTGETEINNVLCSHACILLLFSIHLRFII